jgi:hypothetical protein
MVAVLLNIIDTFDELLTKVTVEINQQIYFVNNSTLAVFEAYNINNIKVIRKLGIFSNNYNSFVSEDNVEENFLKRRADFQGAAFKGMVEHERPSIVLQDDFENIAPYFTQYDTFDVTGLTFGIYHGSTNYPPGPPPSPFHVSSESSHTLRFTFSDLVVIFNYIPKGCSS